jgi:GTPase
MNIKFIDEATIYVKSGKGGAGCVSLHREANVPFGGPDGGNGGNGGNVIFQTVKNKNSLIEFRFKQHFRAKNGEGGKGKNRNGRNGQDMIIEVPLGTQIFNENNQFITDLDQTTQDLTFLDGGRGGLGNASFKSATNQTPRKAQPGEESQEKKIILKLKIISDIGIIGYPNAGKSTLLRSISSATPKIANYPFTTLKPELGVVFLDPYDFVVADIPGLIEGASEGVGLGQRFLKHIERCKILFHLIDATESDVCKQYQNIRMELEKYSQKLAKKPEIIALNKIDLLSEEELKQKQQILEKLTKQKIHCLSALKKENIPATKKIMLEQLISYKENSSQS